MATVVIRNPNDLIAVLKSRMQQALQMTQDEVYSEFLKSWEAYYNEPVFDGSSTPKVYERTYKLLESLIKTDIVQSGNGFSCTVEVDPNFLNYNDYEEATGREVLEWANAKTHGGTVQGEIEIWNDALEKLGGESGIRNLMKENLQKCGIKVI